MNINKETIIINNCESHSLGLQIILATNSKTSSVFAIISDVNPAGCCYQESVFPGDILFSFNGTEINSFEKLYDASRFVLEEEYPVIKITIIRKGVLDGSNLFKRCIDSPCTELCQVWKEKCVRIKKRVDTIDRTILPKEGQAYTLKSTRTIAVDTVRPKMSSTGSIDDDLMSDKLKSSYIPKIKYHQKALPMLKSKKSALITHETPANFVRRPTKMSTQNMIASPEPHFIRRPNARTYENVEPLSNMKQAKSLTSLNNLEASSRSSDTSSTSSSSPPLVTNFVPRKAMPTFKPTPMPRNPVNKLSYQRSLESREFSPLSCSVKNDKDYQPVLPNDKSFPAFSKELLLNLKDELKKVRQHNELDLQTTDFPSVNHSLSSKLPQTRGKEF